MTTKEKRERVRRIVDIPIQFIVRGRLYQGQIENMDKEGWVKNIKSWCFYRNRNVIFGRTGYFDDIFISSIWRKKIRTVLNDQIFK